MTTATHPALELNHSFSGGYRLLSRWFGVRLNPNPARQLAGSNVSLACNEMHVVTRFQGGSIACTQGCVWLTHDGDCRDVVLESGQQHVADRDSRLVIYAIATSGIRLIPPAATSREMKWPYL